MENELYLISSEEIDSAQANQHVNLLNPNAVFFRKSLSELTGITGFGFHLIEVKPGRDTTEFHSHYNQDECIYILSGQAVATIGDQTFTVKGGDFIGYRKGGLAHSISNTGTEILRYIVVGERSAQDVVDFPHRRTRQYKAAGVEPRFVVYDNLLKPSEAASRSRN